MNAHPSSPTLALISTSLKTDERRLPVHPEQLNRIDPDLRPRILLESGYGSLFGIADSELAALGYSLAPRATLLASADIVVLPKPQPADLLQLSPGSILWGWPHCVQDAEITQIALDRSLTLIAFESMFYPLPDGGRGLHVFHMNNELAGYCSVLHAMQLRGMSGDYGRRRTAVVIGFGSTARGAVTALAAQGVHDVSILTHREVAAVAAPIHSAEIVQFDSDSDSGTLEVLGENGTIGLVDYLADTDIIMNCSLQDPNNPLMYLYEVDLDRLSRGALIVDVSCDEGMGFEWATPSGFADPIRIVGPGIHYYAVDHSPSLLWDSASWEIGAALTPLFENLLASPEGWKSDPVLAPAVEIEGGRIRNPAILEFQRRDPAYPHARLESSES